MCDYDVIAIAETSLNSTYLDGEIAPPGWILFRRDRPQPQPNVWAKGGGMLIMAREKLGPVQLSIDDRDAEQLWIKTTKGPNSLFIGVAYVPPRSSPDVILNVAKVYHDVEKKMNECDDAILCTDLKQPILKWLRDDEFLNVYFRIDGG